VRLPNRFIVVGCAELELYAAILIFLGQGSCQKIIPSSHHPVYPAERCQKGWRRRFVDLHIHNIRRDLERLLVVRKATHDQYATTPENHHVIEKLHISPWMSLNQQLIAEFSPCTPCAPQLRDLPIQTLRPCANVRVPPTASTSTLTVLRRETAYLTVASLLKTACPRTKRSPGTASGPSCILR
jgi:hypothetical protein